MGGKPIGTVFVELDLDATKFTAGQKKIIKDAGVVTFEIERNYSTLGIKSGVMFDAMRLQAENAYQGILHSARSSADDIVRAEQAKNAKIQSIDEQQYGRQVGFMEKLKSNWVGTTAAIAAAWMVVNKAVAWADLGAKAQQAEDSFRHVSSSANVNVDQYLSALKRASGGTVDESDIMQRAVKGMVLGLSPGQMIRIMEAARVGARYAGEDVKDAYENITNAIATGMPRALRQYGLVSKEEFALINQALKVGIENVDLYSIAMMNAGIKAEKMGEMHKNAAEKLQAFHAQVKDIKESVGKATIAIGEYLLAGLNGLASFIVRAAQGMATVLSIIPGSVGAAAKEAQGILSGVNKDLMADRAKLLGIQTSAQKAETAAAQTGAAERTTLLEKEKAAYIAKLKAQIEAAKNGAKAEEHLLILESELATKRASSGDAWYAKLSTATEAANSAMMKFASEGLLGEEKALAAVDAEMEAVNAKLREQYGVTAESIDIDAQYVASLAELMAAGEKRKEQIRETAEQHKIATNSVLKDITDQQRASVEAETGVGGFTPAKEYGFEDAMKAAEAYGNVDLAIQQMNADLGTQYATIAEGQSYIDLYKQAWLDANLAIADSMRSLYGGMQNWVSSSLQGLITHTMTAMDVLRNLGKMMLSIVTDYVAKWLVGRMFMAVMDNVFLAQQTATTVAAAGIIGAAWLEPAYLATVATLGAAAAEGVGALALGMAGAQALGLAAKGFSGTLGGGLSDAINGGTGAAFASGSEYVPATMPALIHKGERILTPEQNKDFTEFIGGNRGGGGGGVTQVIMDGVVFVEWINDNIRGGRIQLRPA